VIIVLATAVVCFLLKYLRKIWDKKRKSDTYEIVNHLGEEEAGETLRRKKISSTEPKLSSLIFTGDNKKQQNNNQFQRNLLQRRDLPLVGASEVSRSRDETDFHPETGNGTIQVEANVHDSSNETHETSLEEIVDIEEGSSNTETLPMTSRRKPTAPLAATESDV